MASYINPYYSVAPMSNYTYGIQQPAPMQVPQQSYSPQPVMSSNVIPVDGEVGAKAFMVPSGSTGPIALWDTNDNVIYLRTFNAAGMPNPLRKLRYTEEEPMQNIVTGSSGDMDTSQFVTKKDFEQLKQEIQNLTNRSGNTSTQYSNNQYTNNQNRSANNTDNRRG